MNHRSSPVPVPGHRRTRRSTHVAALALAGVVAALAAPTPTALAATGSMAWTVAARGGLVVNGSFENELTGWKVNQVARQQLALGTRSVSGASSARLTATDVGTVSVSDRTPTIASTTAGRSYQVSVYVRSTTGALDGRIRVREMRSGTRLAKHVKPFVATEDAWTQVQMTYTTSTDGSAIDLSVVGRSVPSEVALLVDDVVMVDVTTPSVPPPPAGECVSDPMGIPAPGSTFLGAAVGGTTDIDTRESQLGQRMALHRTYYQATQIDRAVKAAKADLAVGRLPWISFKAPLTWAEMANGDGAEWSRQLADGLATVPGPVWLAVHHEPENDGDMTQWTQMQAQIAPIIHARTDNVAYSVIYSGWNTFGGGNNTVAEKWPGDTNIDILAVDAYNNYGAVRDGVEGTKALDLSTYFAKMAAWSAAHGTAWAIGESGQTTKASAIDPTWLDRTFHAMVEMGGAGYSYFDSTANSVADWTLDDPIKFTRFQGLMPHSAHLC